MICPHLPEDDCACRKPKTGLLDEYLKNTRIDRSRSWVIGDRETDKELAHRVTLPFLPVSREHTWHDIVVAISGMKRTARKHRRTKETCIDLTVALDSNQASAIDTQLPFFDHMLEQVAQHGHFDLKIMATGDLEVDDHHLVEDVEIALGEALKEALGDKWGINRYGFILPMDESLASIAIDISGRSFCQFNASFTREFVGGMATEMVPHFFQSFASALGATIHLTVTGSNHHHMIEACFKALGRALRQALMHTGDSLPSTKGLL